jgi:hypothetical protein
MTSRFAAGSCCSRWQHGRYRAVGGADRPSCTGEHPRLARCPTAGVRCRAWLVSACVAVRPPMGPWGLQPPDPRHGAVLSSPRWHRGSGICRGFPARGPTTMPGLRTLSGTRSMRARRSWRVSPTGSSWASQPRSTAATARRAPERPGDSERSAVRASKDHAGTYKPEYLVLQP